MSRFGRDLIVAPCAIPLLSSPLNIISALKHDTCHCRELLRHVTDVRISGEGCLELNEVPTAVWNGNNGPPRGE